MKVTLVEHGGLAALKPPARIVDTASLPPDDARRLAALVADAVAAPPPDGSALRDAIRYRVTLDDGRVLAQSGGAMSDAFRALVTWLKQSR